MSVLTYSLYAFFGIFSWEHLKTINLIQTYSPSYFIHLVGTYCEMFFAKIGRMARAIYNLFEDFLVFIRDLFKDFIKFIEKVIENLQLYKLGITLYNLLKEVVYVISSPVFTCIEYFKNMSEEAKIFSYWIMWGCYLVFWYTIIYSGFIKDANPNVECMVVHNYFENFISDRTNEIIVNMLVIASILFAILFSMMFVLYFFIGCCYVIDLCSKPSAIVKRRN